MKHELTTYGDRGTVRTYMHVYYRKFIEELPSASADRECAFEDACKCIIWGGLYIEALTNSACERTITWVSQASRIADETWRLVERTGLLQKVDFLTAVYATDEPTRTRARREVRKLVELRNRLVHYKDAAMELDRALLSRPVAAGKTHSEAMRDLLNAAPDTRVVQEVLSETLDDRRAGALWVGDFLEELVRRPPDDLALVGSPLSLR